MYFTCPGAPGCQKACILRVPGPRGAQKHVFYVSRGPGVPKSMYFRCPGAPGCQKAYILRVPGPLGAKFLVFYMSWGPGVPNLLLFMLLLVCLFVWLVVSLALWLFGCLLVICWFVCFCVCVCGFSVLAGFICRSPDKCRVHLSQPGQVHLSQPGQVQGSFVAARTSTGFIRLLAYLLTGLLASWFTGYCFTCQLVYWLTRSLTTR